MYGKVCPVCKNQFYSDSRNFESDYALHNECVNKKSKDKRKRPARTSTPVAELEYSPAPSFSDSVTDFFYQSWKSGLHSDDTSCFRQYNQNSQQQFAMIQPVCYAPQIVYVNTVIFQPYMPTSYVQQVGYRPDGTFGVLPTYWS